MIGLIVWASSFRQLLPALTRRIATEAQTCPKAVVLSPSLELDQPPKAEKRDLTMAVVTSLPPPPGFRTVLRSRSRPPMRGPVLPPLAGVRVSGSSAYVLPRCASGLLFLEVWKAGDNLHDR